MPERPFVKLSLRIAHVLHGSMKSYCQTQKEVLGRSVSLHQLIVDSIVEKLTREGFLPVVSDTVEILEDDELPYLGEPNFASDTTAGGVERPWETIG